MFRVDTATAVAAPPAQNAAGTPGYFTQGDPAGGVPATIPGQDWFNNVQEELMSIVLGAGLTPDKANDGQVWEALQILMLPVGTLIKVTTPVLPYRTLSADGAAYSRTTYAGLFKLYVTDAPFTPQTFTCTLATPGVFTKNSHGFLGGERLRLYTTGALPTGLTTVADYFVEVINANTFYLLSTEGGTRVNTSGAQSGVHTYLQSYWGLGDGVNTFNVPDLRNDFTRGWHSGRAFASWEADMFKSHTHPMFGWGGVTIGSGAYLFDSNSTGHETGAFGGTETRPRNRAVLYAVRY